MADQTNELCISLESASSKIFVPKAAVLFRAGEKSFGTFLVLSGQVRVEHEVRALS